MGHILIKNLKKDFVERRAKRRNCEEFEPQQDSRILVLDDISLEFETGEMVCILGPSGCGKSTLLRIIAGFDRDFQGTVTIDGEAVTGPNPNHIFVYQENALLPWMTVWQNVGLGLRKMESGQKRNDRIQEYIDMVELEGFERRYPYELSGGMKRRAELARALAVNPDALFMDEPFTGLDFLTHMRMREEVVNVHEYLEKTILFVTHDIDDALIMGDRIVVLSGRPASVKLNERLDFPRPRDYEKEPGLRKLRAEVFLMLGVPYAV